MSINGTYLGFAPSSKSAIGAGEIEVVVSDTTISYRIATGLDIVGKSFPLSDFRELTAEEMAIQFELEPAGNPNGTYGLRLGDSDIAFTFRPIATTFRDDNPRLIAWGLMDDGLFVYAALFGPEQVGAGLFHRTIDATEVHHGMTDIVPRLAYHGRAHREP